MSKRHAGKKEKMCIRARPRAEWLLSPAAAEETAACSNKPEKERPKKSFPFSPGLFFLFIFTPVWMQLGRKGKGEERETTDCLGRSQAVQTEVVKWKAAKSREERPCMPTAGCPALVMSSTRALTSTFFF